MEEYWFKTKTGRLRLPVPLEKVPESKSADIQTFNILGKGEICFFGGLKAGTIQINSFFPGRKYSFCQYDGFPPPQECKAFFNKILEEGELVTFIVTGTDINKEYFIEKFDTETRQGRGDLYFSLGLREAPKYNIKKVSDTTNVSEDLKRNSKHANASSIVKAKNKTQKEYIVNKNETLNAISHKFYGTTKNANKIYEANKKNLKNKNILKPGIKLVIPDA